MEFEITRVDCIVLLLKFSTCNNHVHDMIFVCVFFFLSLKILEGNAIRKGGQRKRRKRRCAHAKKSKYLPQLLKKYSAQCENEDTDQKLVSTIASDEKNATVSKGFFKGT